MMVARETTPLSAQWTAVVGLLLCCATEVHADARPAVVELFTSEGCSSCPPAEAYIGEIARRPDVLALAFHVDYWDDLGWKDRFGLREAGRRQQVYADALRLGSMYTPQVVVDGRLNFLGSDRAAIDRQLNETRDGVALTLRVQEGDVGITLNGPADGRPSDVLLVAYQRTAVSSIGRGENAGRTLTESNIVRAVKRLGSWSGGTQQYRVPVAALPGGCTDAAVLVQSAGQGPITGAAELPLHGR